VACFFVLGRTTDACILQVKLRFVPNTHSAHRTREWIAISAVAEGGSALLGDAVGSGHSQQAQHLALQVGELGREDANCLNAGEHVDALGRAEQSQDVLGGGMPVGAGLGLERQLVDLGDLHELAQFAPDEGLHHQPPP
jgi:hypothetical protein